MLVHRLILRRPDGRDRDNLFWPTIELAVDRAFTLAEMEPLFAERWRDGSFLIDSREVNPSQENAE